MKMVKFIESINIKETPLLGRKEIQYDCGAGLAYLGPEHAIPCDEAIKNRVVPVHHSRRAFNGGNPASNPEVVDTFIAYSKEVQELLGMPFDDLKTQLDREIAHNFRLGAENGKLLTEVNGYEYRFNSAASSSLWQRLKFLFSGNVDYIF